METGNSFPAPGSVRSVADIENGERTAVNINSLASSGFSLNEQSVG
jgi:hypothetical protein